MLKVEKDFKIKIIIVTTQIYLSIFRSEKDGAGLKDFYLKNEELYMGLKTELDNFLIGKVLEKQSKPWKIMTRITCGTFFKNKMLLDDLLLTQEY